MTYRTPVGDAFGGIVGQYPHNLAIGRPAGFGMLWLEDWLARDDTSGGFYGEKGWRLVSGSIAVQTPLSTDEHEAGLRVLTTGSTSGNTAIMDMGFAFFDQEPPIGTIFEVKVFAGNGTSNMLWWVGLQDSSTSTVPSGAGNTDFVGVRYDFSASSNIFGVSRNGTSETTLDLATAALSTTAYNVVGFERMNSGAYEFYVVTRSADERVAPTRTVIGEIDADHPNESLRPVIGVQTQTNAARTLIVDYYSLCGRCRR